MSAMNASLTIKDSIDIEDMYSTKVKLSPNWWTRYAYGKADAMDVSNQESFYVNKRPYTIDRET